MLGLKLTRPNTDDITKIAEMIYGVTEEVTRLGCSMIAEEGESYDELLRIRKNLKAVIEKAELMPV